MLEAARRAGVPRVVYASTDRLTGSYSTGEHISIEMPARPDGFYGVSTVAGKTLCRPYADKFGISTISLRIGSDEEQPGSAREQRTWLSPADAIRAFVAAMTTPEHTPVFYAVSANTDGWWGSGSSVVPSLWRFAMIESAELEQTAAQVLLGSGPGSGGRHRRSSTAALG